MKVQEGEMLMMNRTFGSAATQTFSARRYFRPVNSYRCPCTIIHSRRRKPSKMLSRTARQALATSSRLSTPQSPFLFPLRAASSSTPPPSANTTDTKSRPEVLPRSGFFAQKPKASPPAGRKKDLVVPPLARPPGVPTPPTTERKTWSEKKGEFLDADRHTAKRKAL